ncbi:bifunctional riboflavin kinase/FAD synthetase [Actibacterium pelagium]|uniref:Riboflavin biosynthesis protein n=1 Tax=Actibacterium pelagium TaxID=2029103 RepID=A0A917AKQ5_9RHOB|nr:bifunctional riboflavin kinase/FAD synthetase [Actibacterium pelagium]GGE59529.1 riboflavin biosynthesis protein [Actibacterium pelagium]
MQRHSSINDLTDENRGASVAIGNFDGVHLGHQAVLDIARDWGNAPLGVLTFEPHPREFFAPDAPAFRLMNSDARAHRLEKLGVAQLYEMPFNRDLSSLTPDEFVKQVLVDALGVAHVVVGADFCFGAKRSGSAQDLVDLGEKYGFAVTLAQLLERTDLTVSSTQIRNALTEGRPRDAAEMLGHWHRIEGEVITGEQRGRELGFPTANISLAGLHQPRFGVYAVLVEVLDGPHAGNYHGASSIGVRPMFDGEVPNCETFLFDFSADLYGSRISVGLVDYLRPELKFNGLEALIKQMDEDCDQARAILTAL